jgi:uncharacterized UBP type Zn finger protein
LPLLVDGDRTFTAATVETVAAAWGGLQPPRQSHYDFAWVHLRMCMTCGKVGCCDSSPNKHATAHERESGHPIIRSAESGEDWSWCYIDEVAFAFAAR